MSENNKKNTIPKDAVSHYFLGVIVVVCVQVAAMFGGLAIERRLGFAVTGIPSAAGLFVVLLVSGMLSQRLSEYVLLGSFTFAFVAPVILYLVVLLRALPILQPHVSFSLGYMIILTSVVWLYFLLRILRGELRL